MKRKIAIKLFVVTTLVFILFVSAQVLLQSMFFENFYVDRKTSGLTEKLESFSEEYSKNIGSLQNTVDNIKDFEDKNNAKIAILESNGLLSYTTDHDNEMKDSGSIRVIQGIIREWTSSPKTFLELQKKGEGVTYIFNDPNYNIKHIVAVKPVIFNGIPTKVIFAVSSLQPVNEAVGVMREFYIYIYIFGVILTLILAFIYSNMVSKPLVNLNKAASKMAKLDFNEKCEIDREDEIGSLAKTLNFLSTNLSNALRALQESNSKLKEDIEREKELEERRKEFVAAVSHELKTPISLIGGYAEGIKDGIVEGEDKDYYINVIIDEAEKMGELVTEMLELSKLESGSFKIQIDTFYLDKSINETIKRLDGIALNHEAKVNINKEIEEGLQVLGDRNKIEEVISNFLTNAIRHTKEGGNIYVRTLIVKEKVVIEIENEGQHIPEEDIERVWDKFYKVDKARSRSAGGTGLGLSIVKNILKIHESEYGVENTEIGVKFYFTLEMNSDYKGKS
jgi:signal transduction histidine kinase